METAIKKYLDNRAKTDELFAAKYANPKKSIDECCKYITGEAYARAKNGCSVISDEEVYGMAVHYYDEENIEIRKAPNARAVKTNAEPKLTKTQLNLFVHAVRHQIKVPIHAVKICNRKGYCIEDPGVWLDYIENLRELGLDTHNAYYVCPDDLHAAHERMVARLRKIREREKREKRLAEIAGLEVDYLKTKGKFFGICFGNENIIVTVIQSVADIEAEGRAMRHCVFVNEYYKKDDSLILSAKDKDGNRLETIEVNTKTFQVIQSRGVCNQNTPHHNKIINLVNNNMYRIRQAI